MCFVEPLWLRGRVTGLLLCIGMPVGPLEDIAKQGAAALELANQYTDTIEAARRRKPTTPAAEIQQNLFPPRIARIARAQLTGALLPTEPAATAMAIQRTVTDCWSEPLQDDATVVVLAVE
jgi:hypothetical protein